MSLQDELNSINILDFEENVRIETKFTIITHFKQTNDTFGFTSNGDVIYITKYGMFDLDPNIQLTVTPSLSFCDVFKHGITLDSQFQFEISKARQVETVIQKKILTNKKYFEIYDLDKYDLDKYDLDKYDLDKYDLYNNKKTAKSASFMLNKKNIKQISKTARSRKKKIFKPNKLNEIENNKPFPNDILYLDICNENQYICQCNQCIINKTCQCCGVDKELTKYNSIYSINGSLMCDDCAKYECCGNCGWESGGSYCNYCRFVY